MSNRYNLRVRAETGPANQSRERSNLGPLPPYTPTPVRDAPPHLGVGGLVAGRAPALYSQVAASRTPSPQERGVFSVSVPAVRPVGELASGDNRPVDSPVDTVDRSALNVKLPEQGGSLTSSSENVPSQDMEDATWTTVRRRRARSLGSIERTRSNLPSRNTGQARELTRDQAQVVDTATSRLTESQRKVIERRQEKMGAPTTAHFRPEGSDYSQEEGPSRPKGKGVDPRNWGEVNVSQESLDLEAQAAALKSLEESKRGPTKSKKAEKPHKATRDQEHRPHPPRLPAESRPVAQLAQDSYLGRALQDVGRMSTSNRKEGSQRGGYYYPSDSEPSDDDDPRTESSEDERSSPEEEHRRRRNNRHGRSKRRKRRSSSSESTSLSRMVIKPIAPKPYDGGADSRTYHRFVRESEAYLRDGRVKGRRRIFLLSYYLTDKAYDFYTQKIANHEQD
jgi:hypothetical protein